MHKEAGRPWPIVCPDDDVTDYMIMEAVCLKVQREDADAQKEAEKEEARESFKKDHSSLDQFR